MEILITILYVLILCILFFVAAPFIVLTHELGHAVAYFILTKPDTIDIYVGSYSDSNGPKIRIGKLTIYFKFSFPIMSNKGLCCSSKQETNYIKWIIILIAGSISSLLLACIIAWFVFNYDLHGLSKLFSLVLIGYSILAMITSLFQSSPTNNECEYYNDGENILLALKLKNKLSVLKEIPELIANNNYKDAIANIKIVLKSAPDYVEYHRLLVQVLLWDKEFNKAKNHLNVIASHFTLKPTDYATLGYVNSMLQNKQFAIENYELCLKYDPTNVICLNNVGLEYTETNRYKEAEKYLKFAIDIQPDFWSAYAILGYCKILQNQLDEGKALIEKSISMDTMYSYAYKALGLYYIKTGDTLEAKKQLDKAREIDNTINLDFPDSSY
ncbi:tetratricopeptide repeat protein [Mucilaginibacter limnophilus]|uniref:Tetratricopeptide repeat protein n=1 Tax=Mucilaginibacter limnophilus TaxID=1932778 RepID=A0A3S2V3H5_9SPHI|nr:tetratricopeptide repeat protein [Mucilaginibacter limnophilus]RVU02415.1 tetratricopeptide repeat protein [Mucilaginibacter limnophilus]